jgi:hypothetical protein
MVVASDSSPLWGWYETTESWIPYGPCGRSAISGTRAGHRLSAETRELETDVLSCDIPTFDDPPDRCPPSCPRSALLRSNANRSQTGRKSERTPQPLNSVRRAEGAEWEFSGCTLNSLHLSARVRSKPLQNVRLGSPHLHEMPFAPIVVIVWNLPTWRSLRTGRPGNCYLAVIDFRAHKFQTLRSCCWQEAGKSPEKLKPIRFPLLTPRTTPSRTPWRVQISAISWRKPEDSFPRAKSGTPSLTVTTNVYLGPQIDQITQPTKTAKTIRTSCCIFE